MELKVTGLQKLQLDLKNFSNRVEDRKKFFDIVGAKWVTEIQKSFQKSQDPYGNPWESVHYTKYRNSNKKRTGIGYERTTNPLQDTGRLVGSINYVSMNTKLVVGTPIIYADTHNSGSDGSGFGFGGVPQRQFIPDIDDPSFDKSNLGRSLDSIIKDYYLGVFDE